MMVEFCPNCFARIVDGQATCPACGTDFASWRNSLSYAERLIHTLRHPLAEVRMRAIIILGKRRQREAAAALGDCAFAHPADVVQGLAIVRALNALPPSRPRYSMLSRIAREHPAHALRQAARTILQQKNPPQSKT